MNLSRQLSFFFKSMGTLTVLLLLPSCLSSRYMRAQEIKRDLSLREIKSEIDEQKYQINRLGVELQIVESKAASQKETFDLLRQEIARASDVEETEVQSKLASLDEKLDKLEQLDRKYQDDFCSFKKHTEEVLDCLAQFKSKIDENEKNLEMQNRRFENLKSSLESILRVIEEAPVGSTYYVVQSGDSLEKIAREHQVSVERIKNLNHLNNDLVILGQKLRLK